MHISTHIHPPHTNEMTTVIFLKDGYFNMTPDGASGELKTISTQRSGMHVGPESRKNVAYLRKGTRLSLAFYAKRIVSRMKLSAIKVF